MPRIDAGLRKVLAAACVILTAGPATAEDSQSGPLDKIFRFFESVEPLPPVPVRLVVDNPWQAQPRVGKAGLRPIRIFVSGPRRALNRSQLYLVLTSRETGEKVWSKAWSSPKSTLLDLNKLSYGFPWGAYDLRAAMRDDVGAETFVTRALVTVLPGGEHCVEVLSNLVSELANARRRGMLDRQEIAFMNPRAGWCFFRLAGEAQVMLDGARGPLLSTRAGAAAAETMRRLPAGKHVLRVRGRAEELIVRAVPALFYNVYQTGTQIGPFGLQTWDLLEKHYFPACNTIEGNRVFEDETARWRARGGAWVAHAGMPQPGPQGHTAEGALHYWRQSAGYSHPLLDGLQVDELTAGYSDREYATFAEAVTMLRADGGFRARQFIPFITVDPDRPGRLRLVESLRGAGWPFSIETYIPETPGAEADRAQIERRLAARAARWDKLLPGSFRHAIVTPMFSSLPYCMANTHPAADFKVHLENQMQVLANHPALFGVYGVQPYRSNYADPETLRWMGALLRHYGIEGRRERLSSDPYELRHVLNPDFDEGLQHWEVAAAEPGGVRTGSYRGYGALQGRWPPGLPWGQNFVLLRRSANGPNTLSQPIRGLKPGRLYSLKLITADYQDLLAGRSNKARTAVRIGLEGVEQLSGEASAFQWPIRSFQSIGPFSREKPFWMNYHWRVFRAKAAAGRLSIADWEEEEAPGGEPGQETIVNFVELQPYFGEDPEARSGGG